VLWKSTQKTPNFEVLQIRRPPQTETPILDAETSDDLVHKTKSANKKKKKKKKNTPNPNVCGLLFSFLLQLRNSLVYRHLDPLGNTLDPYPPRHGAK
jgi:hypothetical protein